MRESYVIGYFHREKAYPLKIGHNAAHKIPQENGSGQKELGHVPHKVLLTKRDAYWLRRLHIRLLEISIA